LNLLLGKRYLKYYSDEKPYLNGFPVPLLTTMTSRIKLIAKKACTKMQVFYLYKFKIVPIKATGEQSATLIKDLRFIIYTYAARGLWYTEREHLNKDILTFI